jgi:ATP-binding cassette, subfamily B, bacterial
MVLTAQAGWSLVAATCLLHMTVGLLPIVFLVCVGQALGLLTHRANIDVWLVVALAAFLLQQLLAPFQLVLSQRIARRIDRSCLRRFTGFVLTQAPLRVLERPGVADRLNQANQAFEDLVLTPGAAAEAGLALIARYSQLAGAVVVTAVTAGPRGAAAAVLVAVVTRRGQSSAFHRWGRLIRDLSPARRKMIYIRDLATGLRAAKEIRTLGLFDWIDRRYEDESRRFLLPLWSWRRRVYGAPFALYSVLGVVGIATALVAVATMDTAVGPLTMAVQAVVVCARFGVYFPESDTKMVYGRSAWEALLEFEETCRTAADPGVVVPSRPVPRPLPAIRLTGVCFGYERSHHVLQDLDLELAPGTSTALVGVNGAGKTTLVKLLTGLYRPDAGTVTLGDVDLAMIDPAAWRRRVAVTFQDYVRYELTLRDNVAMGAIAHREDDEGIYAVLARVGLGDMVAGLVAGLETPMTRAVSGGRELSGGQWQRLALARSMFAVRHGASVLVLDEPTAQLDARGEAEFFNSFLDLTRGVTSLIISHRFSSVRRADRIVVLDGGRIIERGDHDRLVAAGGTYAALFAAQASRFMDTGKPA